MLSKKAQYAFQALMYMADKPANEPTLIAEIAKKRKIPLKFLENILLQLKNEGVLESKKGKGGGYFFKVPPRCFPALAFISMNDAKTAMKNIADCTTRWFRYGILPLSCWKEKV